MSKIQYMPKCLSKSATLIYGLKKYGLCNLKDLELWVKNIFFLYFNFSKKLLS